MYYSILAYFRGSLAYSIPYNIRRDMLNLSRERRFGIMANRKTNESKIMPAILRNVRRIAVRNAGVPSLKGAFEKKVPESLKK